MAWLDPVDKPDELGLLEGDWSWPPPEDWSLPLLDELELVPEPDVEPSLEPVDELPAWPA